MRTLAHHVLFAIVVLSLVSTTRPAWGQSKIALSCLSHDRIECGCSIRLVTLACPKPESFSRYHLHAGLHDGAPLWIRVDDREIELRSIRTPSQSFSFSPGDRWKEKYVGNGLTVELSYRPGKSTCPKIAPETCEYFDVDVTVVIRRGDAQPEIFEGVGTCGC
jgi:hypothetical protein